MDSRLQIKNGKTELNVEYLDVLSCITEKNRECGRTPLVIAPYGYIT